MSGKPNPEGVKELRRALKAYSDTRNEIAGLEMAIRDRQKSLEVHKTELSGLRVLIEDVMDTMDVSSIGNFGWEQRRLEMLLMIVQLYD